MAQTGADIAVDGKHPAQHRHQGGGDDTHGHQPQQIELPTPGDEPGGGEGRDEDEHRGEDAAPPEAADPERGELHFQYEGVDINYHEHHDEMDAINHRRIARPHQQKPHDWQLQQEQRAGDETDAYHLTCGMQKFTLNT